jgi:hypothetical protein
MAKHLLKGFTVDNTVSKGDLTDKRLVLDAVRSVNQEFVIEHMLKLYHGLTRTIVEAIVKQFGEAIIDLVCAGYTVTTDTCRYAPSFKGLIRSNVWDPERNTIHVNITQGKRMREEINDTVVQILGDKPGSIFIASTHDTATAAEDNTATPGAMFNVYGKGLKVVEGSITLTDSKGKVITIPAIHWANNMPKRLTFLIPSNMKEGDYTLTITTRRGSNKTTLLKKARVATTIVTIGTKSTPPSEGEPGGSTPDPNV